MSRLIEENPCEICESVNGQLCNNSQECIRYKLYEIENKQEKGLLVEFPCALGTTLYNASYNCEPLVITDIKFSKYGCYQEVYLETKEGYHFDAKCIGESLFFTKEEAKAKRQELIEKGDFGILDRTDKPADLGDIKIVNSSEVSL